MKTLAQAQVERDYIKMKQAEREYEKVAKSVVDRADVDAFALVQKRVCDDHLAKLSRLLAEAVGDEKNETRIHYLMSDCAIDWLRELGELVEKSASERMAFAGKAFHRASKPRDLLTVSQWAERYRVIETGSNAPGRWDNSRAPHATEIMDSLSEHSPVRTVTFLKASGVSGTEIMLNWIGYNIHHAQKDMMFIVPTLDLRDRTFNPKLDKLFRETPVLAEMINTKNRSSENRQDLTEAGSMRLIKSGANSPDSLRAEHIPYVCADEIDAFPWDVGGEGDPKTLIENRQKTFSRAKSLYVSTPTTEGTSHIEQSFFEGDQRHRQVPCPHCGEFHELLMANFTFKTSEESEKLKKKIVTDAFFACPECGGIIEEGMKNEMLEAGRWVAKQPHVKSHRSYKITSFYIKFGLGLTWREIAQRWVDAQGDTSKLKAFFNTYLAESWRENETGVEAHELMARLETFPTTPMFLMTCAGVDVQKDRLEMTVVKFSQDEEAWLVDHIIIGGDPTQDDVWQELAERMAEFEVVVAGVDAGYLSDMVHKFCDKRMWAFPVKGEDGAYRPIIEDERKRMNKLRARRKRARPQEIIGTHQAKTMIFARLRMPNAGPGYIHFPNNGFFDDAYFNQLTAERLVTKLKAGKSFMEWTKKQERNEALDCFDSETEVLTDRGWIAFSEADFDDKFATVNLNTDYIEYQHPQALIAKPYTGDLCVVEGKRLNFAVTPNHRMVTYKKVFDRKAGKWNFNVPPEITLAKDLTIHHTIKISAKWQGKDIRSINIPAFYSKQGTLISEAVEVDAIALASFLGWYVSEGHSCQNKFGASVRSVTCIAQTKPDGREKIEQILNKLPWKWHATDNSFVMSSAQLYHYIQSVCQGNQSVRVVPEWIKKANTEVIQSFVTAAVDGDGWIQKGGRSYATISKRLADDMAELFLKLGGQPSITIREAKPYFIRGRSGTNVKDQYHVRENNKRRSASLDGADRKLMVKQVAYDGMVYCATVPNGTLIVRRKGKTMVAGNCFIYSLSAFRLSSTLKIRPKYQYIYPQEKHTALVAEQKAVDILAQVEAQLQELPEEEHFEALINARRRSKHGTGR